MQKAKAIMRTLGTSMLALAAATGGATAGGFDVREQSALFQGMSFAGSAAGGTALASMFWNPAAAGYAEDGLRFDSSYALILPRADETITSINGVDPALTPFAGVDTTADYGRDALVPASYISYRLSEDLVLAMSLNSQFGLATKPDNTDWLGAVVGRSSKVFSVNAAPTVAYKVAPWMQIGAGIQIQYFELTRFKAATAIAPGSPSSVLEGDDIGVGYTLGVNFTPAPGTSIGIGFRSSIDHDLEGTVDVVGAPPGILTSPIRADVETPEKITASLRQDLTPDLRAFATVEWTNWSRLSTVPVITDSTFNIPLAPGFVLPVPPGFEVATLDFEWEDGWYFAVGGEYDYSDTLTLRAGFGYEISPIREPSQRLVQLPDNDRYWLSAGASYEVGDLFGLMKDAKIDLAYTHIFVEDGSFERFHPPPLPAAIPSLPATSRRRSTSSRSVCAPRSDQGLAPRAVSS